MTACLLIHGYLGGPFEVEPLAAVAEGLGLPARVVTLPGHASTVDEFRSASFTDWADHAEKEYDRLVADYDRVVVMGFSLGGALALHLAEERSPAAVVALAAPVFPRAAWPVQLLDWSRVFMPGRRFLRKFAAKRPCHPACQSIAPWRGYKNVAHPPHFYGLCKGFTSIGGKLDKVAAPLLIIHDARDRVVNCRNAEAIARGVSSARCELEITGIEENVTVHHVLTTHRETKDFVVERVRDFVASVCGISVE